MCVTEGAVSFTHTLMVVMYLSSFCVFRQQRVRVCFFICAVCIENVWIESVCQASLILCLYPTAYNASNECFLRLSMVDLLPVMKDVMLRASQGKTKKVPQKQLADNEQCWKEKLEKEGLLNPILEKCIVGTNNSRLALIYLVDYFNSDGMNVCYDYLWFLLKFVFQIISSEIMISITANEVSLPFFHHN